MRDAAACGLRRSILDPRRCRSAGLRAFADRAISNDIVIE
jgi:hypothetical protein